MFGKGKKKKSNDLEPIELLGGCDDYRTKKLRCVLDYMNNNEKAQELIGWEVTADDLLDTFMLTWFLVDLTYTNLSLHLFAPHGILDKQGIPSKGVFSMALATYVDVPENKELEIRNHIVDFLIGVGYKFKYGCYLGTSQPMPEIKETYSPFTASPSFAYLEMGSDEDFEPHDDDFLFTDTDCYERICRLAEFFNLSPSVFFTFMSDMWLGLDVECIAAFYYGLTRHMEPYEKVRYEHGMMYSSLPLFILDVFVDGVYPHVNRGIVLDGDYYFLGDKDSEDDRYYGTDFTFETSISQQ